MTCNSIRANESKKQREKYPKEVSARKPENPLRDRRPLFTYNNTPQITGKQNGEKKAQRDREKKAKVSVV